MAVSQTDSSRPQLDVTPPASAFRSATVLVVDDEPEILDFLTSLLEDEGYHVLQAMNATDALKAARERSPDIVLSDLMMPRHSGVELYRWLCEETLEPRMIFMGAISRKLPLSSIPFLEKPFDIEDVLRAVSDELGRAAAPSPVR